MATTDSRNEGYRAFDDMTTWETGKAPDDRRRNTAKWTIVKKLVADVTWLQHEATREQRTHLHAYLHVIASSTAVPLQGRLAALDLGLSSGLLSRQGCHWYARKALLDLGDKPAASNLSLAVQWLRDHIMLDDISVQTVIGAALVHVDQDDRRKMLAMLLEDLVGPGSDTRLGLLGCLLAAWESVGAALRPIFSPSPASNGFATEASAITDLDRRGVRAGECGHAPQAHPERMTKALSDLRDTGAAWLRRLWQAPDVTIQLRLAYAALDLWAPAATIDTLASERTLIEERQETVALLLDIILGWRIASRKNVTRAGLLPHEISYRSGRVTAVSGRRGRPCVRTQTPLSLTA